MSQVYNDGVDFVSFSKKNIVCTEDLEKEEVK